MIQLFMIGFTSQLACTGRMYMFPLCTHAMQTDSGGGATELYTHRGDDLFIVLSKQFWGYLQNRLY